MIWCLSILSTHAAPTEPSHIQLARRFISAAQAEAAIRNKFIIDNVHLARRTPADSSDVLLRARSTTESAIGLIPNNTVASAAALLAEYDASSQPSELKKKASGTFWMEGVPHGKSAFAPADYKVWRNVKDYGARGDGVTDDTAAINRAIADQDRCGQECGSSTVRPAVVYFPGGTYLVSSSIVTYYNTQLIGNPNDRPTIKAAGSFVGLGVITTNPYIPGGDGGQWYIPQSNFLRQIRNFAIDTQSIPNIQPAGIHWQIAQATSLQNIEFIGPTSADANHQGIFMENGSGGMLYDLVFRGGALGMYCGNQQFTTRNLKFINTRTAIQLHWNWGWTWKSLDIQGAQVGVSLVGSPGTRETGSVIILDSVISNTATAILVPTIIDDGGETNTAQLVLDNVKIKACPTAVKVDGGAVLLAGGDRTIESWGIGKRYADNGNGNFISGADITPKRAVPTSLQGTNGYFERSRPQYADIPASGFTDVKSGGAKGDGSSDDTAAINAVLAAQAGKSIVWFPQGTYIVTDTIFVPAGSKIVGEAWSSIMAQGAKFSDINNPKVVVQVGKKGEKGVIEITDMLFTVRGGTAGAVLMEWNIKESSPGSAAMWDSHFRVGGAAGSDLQNAQCPKKTGKIDPKCISAAMLLHLTPTSSAYLENVWAWVADHDLDIQAQTQIDIFVARGILIESQGPTWLYGTASEHCVLYQYQTYKAKNLFMGMIQTETPYFQGTPLAPAPFTATVGKFNADPDFSDCPAGSLTCAFAWGLRIVESSDVFMYGGGLYSWFSSYSQTCVTDVNGVGNCQDKIVEIVSSSGVWLYNLITKASIQMVSPKGGRVIPATENHYAFGSTIMAYLPFSRA
ncbi:glucan 1,3-beta-glucosidase [Peziza echinospora]|nr:glucan 1,3-beta-glucosidase [Peziza echinospora]